MLEKQLIQNIRAGEENALKEVFLRYHSEFLAWSMKYFDITRAESKEIYVLTITALFENIKKGKLTSLDSQLKTYIFGIGKNKVKEYRRTFNNKNVGLYDYYLIEPIDENHDTDYYNQEEIESLQKGLEQIGDPCKRLLEAFYLDGKSMKDIASEYDYKSPNVAKTQKYKCIQRLKNIVQRLNK